MYSDTGPLSYAKVPADQILRAASAMIKKIEEKRVQLLVTAYDERHNYKLGIWNKLNERLGPFRRFLWAKPKREDIKLDDLTEQKAKRHCESQYDGCLQLVYAAKALLVLDPAAEMLVTDRAIMFVQLESFATRVRYGGPDGPKPA